MKTELSIEVLYFEGCPNHAPTVDLVREILHSRGMAGEVKEIEVRTPEQAHSLGFLGSPTIRINGLDVEPEARAVTKFGFSCRTYMDGEKRTGAPSREMISRALDERFISSTRASGATSRALKPSADDSRVLFAGSLAAILASACCLGPLILITLGFGGVWIGSLTRLEPYRPFFMGFALLAMFLAGRHIFRPLSACKPGEVCATPQPRRVSKFLFWATGTLVLVAAVSPHLAKFFY